MNFGNWIVVAFGLFALFIGTLVTVCVRQDVSLVAPDYYKQELNYQQQIERNQNATNLETKPKISVSNNRLQVSFFDFHKMEGGELKLFRPSNANSDQIFILKSSNENLQQFDISTKQRGMYKARMNWKMDGKEFYWEQTIYI